jgi:hypothetical protein
MKSLEAVKEKEIPHPRIAGSALLRKVLMQPEPALVRHDLPSVVKREGVRSVRDRTPLNGRKPPQWCNRVVIVQQNPHDPRKTHACKQEYANLEFQFEKSVFTPNSTQTSQRYYGN